MIKSLKKYFLSVAALFMLATPVLVTGVVNAQAIDENLCQGAKFKFEVDTSASTDCDGETTTGGVQELIVTLINWISIIVGAVAVIMIIWGGFRYVTSGGNDAAVGSAKNTILYAIIGLIIVALAQLIVKFVVSGVSRI